MMRFQLFLSLLLLVSTLGLAQERRSGRKPVLIREDPTEQKGKEEVIVQDPALAKKNVEVGDFYFKRDNLKAAESRYRLAIKYDPEWPEPYEKLIKALEKQGALEAAAEVCREFLEANPASRKSGDFDKRANRLQRQADSNP